MTNMLTSTLQDMGANNIEISIQQRPSDNGGYSAVTMDEEDFISNEMIDQFETDYGEMIEAVSGSESMGSGQVQDGHLYANVSVSGVNGGYQDANHLTMMDGRFIGEKDIKGEKNVAVVSDKLVSNMFPNGEDPLGQEIKAHLGDEIYTFTIIGVYQYEQDAITASMMSMMGMSSDRDITTDLYIPITTEWKLSGAVEGYSYITVLTREGADARNLAGEFEDYFNRFYTRNRDFQITAISLDSIIDQSMTMMSTIQIAIVVIAAISLLVGGIGVPGDRYPQGAGGAQQRHPPAVYRRVGHHLPDRRRDRRSGRSAAGLCGCDAAGLPGDAVGAGHRHRGQLLNDDRRFLRILSGQ